MADLILKDESFAVMGACFEVYNELGPGFLEAVYHEALEFEFAERGIPYVSKPRLLIRFKTRMLTTPYEADFLCFEKSFLKSNPLGKSIQNMKLNSFTIFGLRIVNWAFSSTSVTTLTCNTSA